MKQPYEGLSAKDVRERRRVGLYNKSIVAPSKTVGEIVRSNVFTYFNLVFLILAILLVIVRSYFDLTFLPIILANSLIGIIQELRAKHTLDKLHVLNAPVARVVRDYTLEVVPTEEIVLDDIMMFKAGDQIPADAEIIGGEVAVNESLLTGEADEIMKKEGDPLLSGSFIVYGECYARATKVGADSYAAQLTLKAKAIKTGEQSEIIRSLNSFVKVAGIAIIPIGIILFAQQFFFNDASAQTSVQAMVAAVIGMIPEGLYLLASVTLAISAMRLAYRKVLLHDMKSIETLARVDTLCVDKTGTITSDEMNVTETVWVGKEDDKRKEMIREIIAEVVAVQSADSETMAALKREYKRESKKSYRLDDFQNVSRVIGFSSKYKYSGVDFGKVTYLVGAPNMVLGDQYETYRKKIEKHTKKGMRVLVFGRYNGKVKDNSPLTASFEPLALIVLQNKVRETAPMAFKYFAEQGVEVKVISGDDVATVSEIARQAGILNADKAVDMSTLKKQREFRKAVLSNTVFGRVTPAQKRQIIKILKDAGRTVAMTGDGVNDVLALKDADCSVAMASGTQAAVQASQMVLLDSDFSRMPDVVREGRRVVNNLERSGSLFIVKNLFSFTAALLVICFAIVYPMIPRQVSLVTLWTIGVPSFLLSQIPNTKLIKGKFLPNILTSAAPAAMANLILIMATALISEQMGFSREIVGTLCTMTWAVVGLTNLARVSRPFNKWTIGIFSISVVGMVFCLVCMKWWFGIASELPVEAWVTFVGVSLFSYPTILVSTKLVNWIYKVFYLKHVGRWVDRNVKRREEFERKMEGDAKKVSSVRKLCDDIAEEESVIEKDAKK